MRKFKPVTYKYCSRCCSRAFTLLELLTVVGIIVGLLVILLPVVGRAREPARQSTCISNLRQIGTAFRMYMEDHDDQRPHQLYTMHPQYLSSAELLRCSSDPTESYSFVTWGYKNPPAEEWPMKQSYDYFQPTNQIWRFLESRGPQAGYVLDRCHGTRVPKGTPDRPFFTGLTLRLTMDGAVVKRQIQYPNPNTVLDTWYLMNYNPGEALPKMPAAFGSE